MTPLMNLNDRRIIYHRTYILVFFSHFCERQQTVQMSGQVGIRLNGGDIRLHIRHQIVEQPCFQRQDFLFGAKDFLFIFLQFLRDIALRLCQRLLAYPLCRHLILKCITHFEIITEHVVITDFQRRNTRLLHLALLYFQQIVLTGIGNLSQFVEFRIHAMTNHAALVQQLGCTTLYLALNARSHFFTDIHLLSYPSERIIFRMFAGSLHGFQSLQSGFQGHHFPRCHPSDSHF